MFENHFECVNDQMSRSSHHILCNVSAAAAAG